MIYRIPNIGGNRDGFDALAELAMAASDLEYSSLELSFAAVTWFDANMSAPLGAVLSRIQDRYNTVSIVDIKEKRSILRRNGFLEGFGYAAPRELGSTILPYRRFKTTESNRFYEYLDTHLPGKGIPEMTSDLALRFQQSLGEIFINSQTHSDSALGVFVCGQFYPPRQRLNISLADAGVSIPGRISRSFGIRAGHVKALRWAMMEGNTTKKNAPGGVGLKLIRDFISLNGGRFQIASGKAFWEFSAGREEIVKLNAEFPGTAVNLEVNTHDEHLYGIQEASVEVVK